MIMKIATFFVVGGVLGLAYALIAWLFSLGFMIGPISLIFIAIGFLLSFVNEVGRGLPTKPSVPGPSNAKSKRRLPRQR